MKVEVIKAKIGDVKDIKALIDIHSEGEKMLSRSLSYLYENLRDYFVARYEGKIIGCCSLHISWEDLAEVKSLAVSPEWMGKGVGAALLDNAMKEAYEFGIPKVFTLTLEPEFFKKHGFVQIESKDLPMKIWGECIYCPKYPDCDEIALEKATGA